MEAPTIMRGVKGPSGTADYGGKGIHHLMKSFEGAGDRYSHEACGGTPISKWSKRGVFFGQQFENGFVDGLENMMSYPGQMEGGIRRHTGEPRIPKKKVG